MKKRETALLELLAENGKMEVAVLAEKLETSQVTIRKDLDALEKRGVIRREHGFAIFGGSDDLNNRIAVHYEEKRKIAKAAAGLVSPGETVMNHTLAGDLQIQVGDGFVMMDMATKASVKTTFFMLI